MVDLKRLDIYRKVPKDLTQPTNTGAVVSITCVSFIVFLLFSELYRFLTVEVQSELFVHDPKDEGRIPVQLNISLLGMGCEYVGLDIQDDMGRHEVGFVHNVHKTPEGKGCRLDAKFEVNKVPGNFHVSTHSAKKQPENPDCQHLIHTAVFGENMGAHRSQHGSFNPLGGRRKEGNGQVTHEYHLKVVPSIYEDLGGSMTYSYQYTYAHKEYLAMHHSGRAMPAIWFRYDLTPITVKYTERRPPLYSFLTTICAIIGGTFTVAGIIDSLVFTASEFYKKLEIGKVS